MKRRNFVFLAPVLLGAVLMNCTDDSTTCNIATSAYTNTNAGTVTYTASITGGSTIRSLRYGGPEGEVTVDLPTLPYTNTITVSGGTNIFISVSGIAQNGEVLFGHTFSDGASEVVQDLDSCSN